MPGSSDDDVVHRQSTPRAAGSPARVTLRPAQDADAPQLAELAGELGYPVASGDLARRLAALPPGDEVAVAAIGRRLVGWVHLSSYRTLLSEPHVEVLGLVIRDGYRGRGIGRRLMEHAAAWGLERGLPAVYVRSAVRRVDAHEFYTRLGYGEVKQQRVFVKQTAG